MSLRVADYIAETLAEHGVRNVFLVTGGGAMHLNDALGKNRRLQCIPCHHEQACAMAAESHFRMTGELAAVNVTTGPGGTNAITGVYGAYVDSLAMIVVSGQVKLETTVASTELPLRQLGDQEVDICALVRPITKYAVMIRDAKTVRYHLERALHLAVSGRPGPVWIDVPINIQAAPMPEHTAAYDPREDESLLPKTDLAASAEEILERFSRAERPVILAGSGVRISKSYQEFLALIEGLGAPVTTAWNAHDLLADDHPLYAGRPGTVGDRAGNFAVQSSDFLLVLGCRLNIRQVSYNWRSFARAAFKIVVDTDAAELAKPTVRPDLAVHADLRDLILALLKKKPAPQGKHASYLAWCRARKEKYPVTLPEYWKNQISVNPYCFVDALFRELPEDAWVVTGDGTACVVTFQAARIQKQQRLYTNSGSAPMGYDLPAAVGASIAGGRRKVVCIAGDGSIMLNLQELQTMVTQKLPITIFILNNEGYQSIRQTQNAYFPGNEVGVGPASGVEFPDFEKLASAFRLPYRRIEKNAGLHAGIRAALEQGAGICEVMLDIAQTFSPKLSSRRLEDGTMVSSPLEDLAPFLPRDEFKENLLIDEWKESR